MKRNGPEQWAAVVLREEVERLTIACRMLEFGQGYFEGRAAGAAETRRALAVRPWEKEPGRVEVVR